MRRARQAGLGLVEVMVAVTIGLIVLSGVYTIFISTHRTEMVNQALSNIKDSARFLRLRLQRRIRMAGAGGCATLSTKTIHIDARNLPGLSQWIATPVRGQNNVAVGNALGARAGTDTLSVSEISAGPSRVAAQSNARSANLKVMANGGTWRQGDDVLVTNCAHGDIFSITNRPRTNPANGVVTLAHAANANYTPKLAYGYSSDATIGSFLHVTYFIKAVPGQANADGTPVYALYEMTNGAAAVALVRHVTNFQVTYGIDTTPNDGVDNVGRYVTADQVGDWSLVRSVRLSLVVRSANGFLAPSPQAYPFGLDPADRHFKFLVSDVIAIRNANS